MFPLRTKVFRKYLMCRSRAEVKKKKKKDVIGVGSGMKDEGQVSQTLGKDKACNKEAPALFSFYCAHRLRNR